MIKIIELNNDEKIIEIINKLSSDISHVILKENTTKINKDVLETLNLDNYSAVVDFTVNGYYINDCRYFGDEKITANKWFSNNVLYPNIIFKVEDLKWLLDRHEWASLLDICVKAVVELENIFINGHVIFDFDEKSSNNYLDLNNYEDDDYVNHFYLNKWLLLNNQKAQFNRKNTTLPNNARMIDKVMYRSYFKLPNKIYLKMHHQSLMKQKNAVNIYHKNKDAIKPYIVFLGFDYSYRGNSKYLFEYIKNHTNFTVYFITDEQQGESFVSPQRSETQNLIEQAQVLVLESYIPDGLKPNGTIIQLWHGTPIKKLFLDSNELHQNKNIYNYRARKYNKLIKHNYFITDTKEINSVFNTAFPMQETKIISSGYPRNQFLIEHNEDNQLISQIKEDLQLNNHKQTILYVPTWRDNKEEQYLLEFPKEITDHYNIIYKCHIEDKNIKKTNYIDPLVYETQQLILVADMLISDYSSIIFDALTIDKKVYLYTPDFESYKYHRGLYEEVFNTVNQNQYFESNKMFEAISNQHYIKVNSKYINKNNHSYETIQSIIDKHMNKNR